MTSLFKCLLFLSLEEKQSKADIITMVLHVLVDRTAAKLSLFFPSLSLRRLTHDMKDVRLMYMITTRAHNTL